MFCRMTNTRLGPTTDEAGQNFCTTQIKNTESTATQNASPGVVGVVGLFLLYDLIVFGRMPELFC